MAYALVGTAGTVATAGGGSAVTPAFGQSATANNLLICWCTGRAGSTAPTTPSGWTVLKQVTNATGNGSSATIFGKIAAGADTAPTIAASGSITWEVRLAEFSGGPTSITGIVDQSGSNTGTTSTLVATSGAANTNSSDLILTCNAHSAASGSAVTVSEALNNSTLTDVNNSGASVVSHYAFGYGTPTSVSSADAVTFTFGTTASSACNVVVSLFPASVTITNSFEGGTNGTAISTGNSGGTSGTAFDGTTGSGFTFDTTHVAHGTLAYKDVQATGGTQGNVAWAGAMGTLTTSSDLYVRYYFYITGNPSANDYICRFAQPGTSGGGHICGFGLDSSGHAAIYDTGSSTSPKVVSSGTVPLNQWIRVEGHCGPLSATVGLLEMRVWFSMDSTGTPDLSISSSAANTGTTVPTNLGFGTEKPSTGYTSWFDDIGFSTGTWIGPSSAPSVPGTPAAPTATPGNTQASLTWTAPSNGGATITSYHIVPFIGASAQTPIDTGSSSTSATVTGLTNGTAYTFTVAATNSVGTGSASPASNAVTPASTPTAPTSVTATAGNAQAPLTWSAPSSNGGSAITSYHIVPFIGASAQTPIDTGSTATSFTVTGLTNGTTYTFTVAATNAIGTGTASSASNAVTPSTTPSTPSAPTATGGLNQATITWSAPSSGGSAITDYIVTPYKAGVVQGQLDTASTSTSYTATGLTGGISYTFTVIAVNANGNSGESAASNAVTPTGTNPPGNPNPPFAVAGASSQATVSWTAPASNGGSAVTGYTITPYIGNTAQGTTTVGAVNSKVITGLTNGTAYTFTVFATNGSGNSGQSGKSNAVTPGASPSAPSSASAVAGNALATVSWVAPSSSGSTAITGYVITPFAGSASYTSTRVGNVTSGVVGGLANGVTYTFTVAAVNSVGQGNPSLSTNAVTPTGPPVVTSSGATAVPYLSDDTRLWAEAYRVNNKLKPGLTVRAATDSSYINGMLVSLPAYGGKQVYANAICNVLSPGQRLRGVLNWSVTESLSNTTQTASLQVLDALPVSTTSTTITNFLVGSPALSGRSSTIQSAPNGNYMPSQWCSTIIRYQWVQNGLGVSTMLTGNVPASAFLDVTLAQNQYGSQTYREDNVQYRVFEPEIIQVSDLSKFPDPAVPLTENDSSGVGVVFNEWWNYSSGGVGAYYILVDNEVMRVTKIDRVNNYIYVIPGGRGVAGTIGSHTVGDTVTLLGFGPYTGEWAGFGYLMPQDFRVYQSPFRPGTCFTSYEGYGNPGDYKGVGPQGLNKTFNRANNMCFTGYWFTTSPQASLDDSGVPQVTITMQSCGYVVNEQQISVNTVQRSQSLLGSWAQNTFDEIGYTRSVPGNWLDYSNWQPSLPGSYPLGIMTMYGQNKAFFDHMNDTNMGTECQECQNEYLNYIAQHEGGQASGSIAETRAVGKHIYQESIQVYNAGGKWNAGPLKTYGRLMTALAIASWDNPLEGNSLGTRWTKMPNQLFSNMTNWTNGRVWNGQPSFNFASESSDFDFSNQGNVPLAVTGNKVSLECPFQATYDQQPWSQPTLDLAALNNMTFTFTREGYPVFIPQGKKLRGLPHPANSHLSASWNTPSGWFTDPRSGAETSDPDIGHGQWNLAYGASIDQYTHSIDPSGLYTLVYVSVQTAFSDDDVQFTIPAAGTGILPQSLSDNDSKNKTVWYSSNVGNQEGLMLTSGVQQTDSVTMDNLYLGLDWNTNPASWGLSLNRGPNNQIQVDAQPPVLDPNGQGTGGCANPNDNHKFYFDSECSKKNPDSVKQIQKLINFMIERRYIGPAITDQLGHVNFNLQINEDGKFLAATAAGVVGIQQFLAQANNGVNSAQWPNVFKKVGGQYKFQQPYYPTPGQYLNFFYTDNEGQWGSATYNAVQMWMFFNSEFITTDVWWYVQNGLAWDQYVGAIVGLSIPQYQDSTTAGKWVIDQAALGAEAQDWMKKYFKTAINYGNHVIDQSINQATTKTVQTNFADPRIMLGDVIFANIPGYMSTTNRFGSSNSQVLNGIYVDSITRTMDLQEGTYVGTYQGYRYKGDYEDTMMDNAANYCSTKYNDI